MRLIYNGYFAGMLCVNGTTESDKLVLKKLKEDLHTRLLGGEMCVSFGTGQKSVATELCVDFYPIGQCEHVLGFAIKI